MTLPFADRVKTLKVHPSLPDHRDRWYVATAPAGLPPAADLGVTVPIKDQGQQGSCTGHGFASMFEALEAMKGLPYVARSRAFIYACERILEHDLTEDAGASPLDGCDTLKHRGVCAEAEMPYDESVFDLAPNTEQQLAALSHTIAGYARPLNVEAAKQATVEGRPVGFGISVYESFERVGADGMVPIPQAGEAMLGGHWLFGNAKGYKDDAGVAGGGYFIAQNSWGESAGDHGYYLFPYAYVANRDYTFEMRSIHF